MPGERSQKGFWTQFAEALRRSGDRFCVTAQRINRGERTGAARHRGIRGTSLTERRANPDHKMRTVTGPRRRKRVGGLYLARYPR